MNGEEFLCSLRAVGAGPRSLAAAERMLRSLAPPYDEPEVAAADEERARRLADGLLAACLKRPAAKGRRP